MTTRESVRERIVGRGIALPGDDIDTDRIIPARFMRVLTFTSLGNYVFYDERYDETGTEKKHPFNDPGMHDGAILIVNSNFGCGSSREHAPQALMRSGIRAFIGESFSEIFSGNCTALGLPAVRVAPDITKALMALVRAHPSMPVEIDLVNSLVLAGGNRYPFTMPESDRYSLVSGTWDTLSLLLSNEPGIRATTGRLPYLNGFFRG